jgi:hypothetical protein
MTRVGSQRHKKKVSRRKIWACMGGKISAYSVLCLETIKPLERPRRRWENNTKLDFREKGIGA